PRNPILYETALLISRPFHVVDVELFHVAIFITDKLIAGSEINARIGAEASLRLLLTIIEIVDLGPFRPRIIGLARVGRPGQDFQLRESLAAVTHRRTDAVGSGIAAADGLHVIVFRLNVLFVAVLRIDK